MTAGELAQINAWRAEDGMAPVQRTIDEPELRKHSHYFKPCPFSHIDIYRVLQLFAVSDPCLQHAVKKLLVAGGRGAKSIDKDIQEAIDTLQRWQQMRAEESP
jgi:hypothetical protein